MNEKNIKMQAEELEKVAGGIEGISENEEMKLEIRVKGSEKVGIPRGGRVQVRV